MRAFLFVVAVAVVGSLSGCGKSPGSAKASVASARKDLLDTAKRMEGAFAEAVQAYIEVKEENPDYPWSAVDSMMTEGSFTPETMAAYRKWRAAKIESDALNASQVAKSPARAEAPPKPKKAEKKQPAKEKPPEPEPEDHKKPENPEKPEKVYTREEFKKLVMGKSEADLKRLIGAPSSTIEHTEDRHTWTYQWDDFKWAVKDGASGKLDFRVDVRLQNGKADKLDFYR